MASPCDQYDQEALAAAAEQIEERASQNCFFLGAFIKPILKYDPNCESFNACAILMTKFYGILNCGKQIEPPVVPPIENPDRSRIIPGEGFTIGWGEGRTIGHYFNFNGSRTFSYTFRKCRPDPKDPEKIICSNITMDQLKKEIEENEDE